MLFDETDQTWKGDKERAAALTAIVNSGNRRRTAIATRVERSGAGFDARDFSTFGPKVLCGIGSLPHMVEDRSIPVQMVRRRRDERLERLREVQADSEARPIREGLAGWASPKTIAALRDARPQLPDELSDRAQDAWEALLAIADMAGVSWPALARSAAVALSGEGVESESQGEGVLVLAHIRQAFVARDNPDALSTADILRALVERDDGPWPLWWAEDIAEGRTQAPAQGLARLLRPGFGIRSATVRIGGETPRGYKRADFEDAWSRYLPPSQGGATSKTGATPQVAATSTVVPVAAVAAPQESGNGRVPVKRLIGELLSDGLNRERVAAKLSRLGYPPPNGHAAWDIRAVIEAQEYRA